MGTKPSENVWGLSRIGPSDNMHAHNVILHESNGEEIVIGRHRDCRVHLVSRLVSRHHAFLKRTNGKWHIVDLKSLNGIYVNQQRIPPSVPFPLKEGDMIGIGVPEAESSDQYQYILYKKVTVAPVRATGDTNGNTGKDETTKRELHLAEVAKETTKSAQENKVKTEEVSSTVKDEASNESRDCVTMTNGAEEDPCEQENVLSSSIVSSSSASQSEGDRQQGPTRMKKCQVCIQRCDSPTFVLPNDVKAIFLQEAFEAAKLKNGLCASVLKRRHVGNLESLRNETDDSESRGDVVATETKRQRRTRLSLKPLPKENCVGSLKEAGLLPKVKVEAESEDVVDLVSPEKKPKEEVKPCIVKIEAASLSALGYSQEDEVIVISDDEGDDNFMCSSSAVVKNESAASTTDEAVSDYLPHSLAYEATSELQRAAASDSRKEEVAEEEDFFPALSQAFWEDDAGGMQDAGSRDGGTRNEDEEDFFPVLSQAFWEGSGEDFERPDEAEKAAPKSSKKVEVIEPLPISHRPRWQRGREEWFQERSRGRSREPRKVASNEPKKQRGKGKSLKEKIKEKMNHRIPAPGGGSAVPIRGGAEAGCSSKPTSSKTNAASGSKKRMPPRSKPSLQPAKPQNASKSLAETGKLKKLESDASSKMHARFASRMDFLTSGASTEKPLLSENLKTYKIPKRSDPVDVDQNQDEKQEKVGKTSVPEKQDKILHPQKHHNLKKATCGLPNVIMGTREGAQTCNPQPALASKHHDDVPLVTGMQDSSLAEPSLPKDPRMRKLVSVHMHPTPAPKVTNEVEPTNPPLTKPTRVIGIDKVLVHILSWKVQWLKQQLNQSAPPPVTDPYTLGDMQLSYGSFDEYMRTFLPLLFLETWEAVFQSWRECCFRNSHLTCPLAVLSFELRDELLLLNCEALVNPRDVAMENYPQEGHLLIVDIRLSGSENSGYRVFGYVQGIKLESAKQGKGPVHPEFQKSLPKLSDACLLTLQVVVRRKYSNISTQKIMNAYVVCYMKPLVRQYEAVLNLHYFPLVRDILRPRVPNCRIPPVDLLNAPILLSGPFNSCQMRAILGAAEAMRRPYPIPQIALVQGPPGTGKTHVLVGIVEQLLRSEGSCNQPLKLLVTAPSNAAVDEITRRLVSLKHALQAEKSSRRLRFVRVGQPSQIQPDVRRYWLEELVMMNLQDQDKEELERNRLDIRETEAKINSLEHSLASRRQRGASADDIGKIEERLCNAHKRLTNLQKEQVLLQRAEQDLDRRKRQMRTDILQNADIILSTLNSCRQMAVEMAFRGTNTPFINCVLVDEAGQCTEPELLIPLVYGMCKMVLVGDPQQLPATILSHAAMQRNYQRSLMERFCLYFKNLGTDPVYLLTEQYRMNPEICQFPSTYFYSGLLYTNSLVTKRCSTYPLHPYLLFDIRGGKEDTRKPSNIYNMEEAFLVVRLVSVVSEAAPEGAKINVITPYQGQRQLFEDLFAKEKLPNVDISTVDSFQGQESDIIVLSCVRAQNFSGSIGFVANPQRMNVAITRAKCALYICGHLSSLRGSIHWEELIQNALQRNLVTTISSDTPINDLKNLIRKPQGLK